MIKSTFASELGCSTGYLHLSTNILGRSDYFPMHMTPDDGRTFSLETASGDTVDICIIGGGAAGLSALQAIMGTPQYKSGHWKPTLFEARHKAGGIWYAHNLCYVSPRWEVINRRTQGPIFSGYCRSTIHTALRFIDDEFTASRNEFCGVAVSSLDPGLPTSKSGRRLPRLVHFSF